MLYYDFIHFTNTHNADFHPIGGTDISFTLFCHELCFASQFKNHTLLQLFNLKLDIYVHIFNSKILLYMITRSSFIILSKFVQTKSRVCVGLKNIEILFQLV